MPTDVDALIERDGPSCVWCGREVWRRDLTREHVVPRSRGGHLTLDNAVLACRSCNRRRGSRPVDAFVRELLREGANVNLAALRGALVRLSRSSRRAHRDAADRMLRRLASDWPSLAPTALTPGGERGTPAP
jgi:HNH endonuclease